MPDMQMLLVTTNRRRVPPTLSKIGANIRDRMATKRIGLNQLAVTLGEPAPTVRSWVYGKNIPKDGLGKVAGVLKTTPTKLISG